MSSFNKVTAHALGLWQCSRMCFSFPRSLSFWNLNGNCWHIFLTFKSIPKSKKVSRLHLGLSFDMWMKICVVSPATVCRCHRHPFPRLRQVCACVRFIQNQLCFFQLNGSDARFCVIRLRSNGAECARACIRVWDKWPNEKWKDSWRRLAFFSKFTPSCSFFPQMRPNKRIAHNNKVEHTWNNVQLHYVWLFSGLVDTPCI